MLDNVVPVNALLTIYKSFVRFYLNYGDILYHQPNNESVKSKLKSVKYGAGYYWGHKRNFKVKSFSRIRT